MTRENQDITMYAGDSKQLVITVETTDVIPVDITGASIAWKAICGSHVISKSTDDGISINSATDFAITLSPEDTIGHHGTYYHEAEVTLASGTIATVITGKLIVKQSIV